MMGCWPYSHTYSYTLISPTSCVANQNEVTLPDPQILRKTQLIEAFTEREKIDEHEKHTTNVSFIGSDVARTAGDVGW